MNVILSHGQQKQLTLIQRIISSSLVTIKPEDNLSRRFFKLYKKEYGDPFSFTWDTLKFNPTDNIFENIPTKLILLSAIDKVDKNIGFVHYRKSGVQTSLYLLLFNIHLSKRSRFNIIPVSKRLNDIDDVKKFLKELIDKNQHTIFIP